MNNFGHPSLYELEENCILSMKMVPELDILLKVEYNQC